MVAGTRRMRAMRSCVALIASHYRYPGLDAAENVIATSGSQEAVYLTIKALLDPAKDSLLVVEPSFPVYAKCAQMEGIPVAARRARARRLCVRRRANRRSDDTANAHDRASARRAIRRRASFHARRARSAGAHVAGARRRSDLRPARRESIASCSSRTTRAGWRACIRTPSSSTRFRRATRLRECAWAGCIAPKAGIPTMIKAHA